MEQLPGADAIFLAMETPTAPGHIAALSILDPSEQPDFGYEHLCAAVDARIRLEPRFTCKLREVPLGLDAPYLVPDESFDVRRHVHRLAAPAPGSMHELAELVGQLFSRPLDRGKPLWEIWLIEGIEGGRMATFMTSHHCLLDGVSGAGLAELLCDLTPDATEPILAPRSREAQQAVSELDVALRAARNVASSPGRLASFASRMLQQTAGMLSASLSDRSAPPLPTSVPLTPFNGKVGSRRALSCTSLPLADVKAIKKHFGVTLNDVLLAITGSALRRYLEDRGELPENSLVAIVPMSTRVAEDQRIGNQITSTPVSWATDIFDPVERLRQVHRNAGKSKEFAMGHDVDLLSGMGESLPPGLTNLFMRTLGPSLAVAAMPGNVVVSNVRGTPMPLYFAGARVQHMHPMSILGPGQGLNITMLSYTDHIDVGFTVDPDLVPDAWALIEPLHAGLEELKRGMRPKRQPTDTAEDVQAA